MYIYIFYIHTIIIATLYTHYYTIVVYTHYIHTITQSWFRIHLQLDFVSLEMNSEPLV